MSPNPRIDFETYAALLQLNAAYADALDNGSGAQAPQSAASSGAPVAPVAADALDRWPELFTAVCSYKLQPRENFDRGLPLCTLHFETRGALRDRIYAVRETLYHDPYHQRHVIGAPQVLRIDGGSGALHVQANYVVLRSKLGGVAEVLSTGRYIDVVVPDGDSLRFQQRWAIFDNSMILNSIIQPI
jgi:salicylate 5-hydroxylase small subunit